MIASKIKIIGFPFDANSSFVQGAAEGPAAIIKAFNSESANFSTQDGTDLSTLDSWEIDDLVSLPNEAGNSAFELIRKTIFKNLSAGHKIISLGGDHSIAFPIIDTYSEFYEGLQILQIDAHSDLYDNFGDNPYSHASPFARIMEKRKVGHLTQIGIRTLTPHQRFQANKFNISIHEMKDFDPLDKLDLKGPLYISLDLDAFDPAFAPGVAHHEPGGFSSREVLKILEQIEVPIVGADIVELNPGRDHSGITAMLAGKLLKELIAKMS